ncbi:hypothetical protein [Rhodococcus sp. ANT_H53B]|uniref:hypothetical protein n=1 Tax=Rhodococcus sp. ANT_H53B TaxID=2597357 RepID=UPI0011EBE8D4|nr:hypothetical protein [Rhodococcus sp. ANT_H53B]KAA0925966.1 hypothetical protein FQ188_10455 [Rhodococcus sp. ANT_H53B]
MQTKHIYSSEQRFRAGAPDSSYEALEAGDEPWTIICTHDPKTGLPLGMKNIHDIDGMTGSEFYKVLGHTTDGDWLVADDSDRWRMKRLSKLGRQCDWLKPGTVEYWKRAW